MRSQLPVINKIKDDYRNRSAHSHDITIVDAKECIEYVITVHKSWAYFWTSTAFEPVT